MEPEPIAATTNAAATNAAGGHGGSGVEHGGSLADASVPRRGWARGGSGGAPRASAGAARGGSRGSLGARGGSRGELGGHGGGNLDARRRSRGELGGGVSLLPTRRFGIYEEVHYKEPRVPLPASAAKSVPVGFFILRVVVQSSYAWSY
jgi:hypothetical protein